MSEEINTLVDMGFPKERVELALTRTGSNDVQTLMDWLLSHEGELEAIPSLEPVSTGTTVPSLTLSRTYASTVTGVPDPEPNPGASENINEADLTAAETANMVAKSIKCDDCGKLFKTNDEVEFHAAKTGHENFSESTEEKKPLTEEEKKEQLAKIEAKLKQRRLEREEKEKADALEREKQRIRSGKDMLEAKKRHEELEMKKIIEQRKREKEEERVARQRVRDQIESDKLARKAKIAAEQGAAPPIATVASPPAEKNRAPQNYTDVKLQIRLLDGSSLAQNFGVKEPLSAVRLFVEMNRKDGEGPFNLMTNFPRKVFSNDDYDKPLESLGLAPSATLFITKS